MSGSRKKRPLRPFLLLSLLAALAFAAGCSDANTPGGESHIDASGNSISGWLSVPSGGTHTSSATREYGSGAFSCTQCHGSDLSGGISGASCFGNPAGCHHGPVAGWVADSPAAQNHGVSAKKAPGSSGFVSCQICHGKDFSGGGSQVSCFTCHEVNAPHPAQPWRGSPYTHTTVDNANVPVCAQCHYPGSPNNPPNHPATPAPAGTAPGCLNNTLCHGENPVPHPVDNAWVTTPPAAQPHGNDAKAALGATTGFSYCQTCHGTGTTSPANFGGGSSGVDCYTCHGVSAPHAPKPWRAFAGSPYTHTTTVEAGNATVCAQCHFPGSPNNPANHPATPAPAGTAPGCFNSTLCHGQTFHPAGWDQSTQHGPAAKQEPSGSGGFAYCQNCHGDGTNFSGGAVGISCYTCHLPTANSPHASQWRTGDTYVHTTTGTGNATVCAYCHLNGANSPIAAPSPPAPAGTAPGCFNSTLCHGSGGIAHPVPYNDSSHYTVTSATFPGSCSSCHDVSAPSTKVGPVCQTCHVAASPLAAANCTSCHASPPDGAAPAGAVYANIAGAHAAHIALTSAGTPISCDTCHNGLGTGTLNHYNRAKARVAPGDAALLAAYNAKTVPFSFDNAALSCSNVSCHGGQATPNWQTGTLNVNTQCTNCHASGTAQYNGYSSGEHTKHASELGLPCTTCHNTTTLAGNHFTTLSTTAMEGPASATIGGTGTVVTSYSAGSCTPSVGASGGCHGTRSW